MTSAHGQDTTKKLSALYIHVDQSDVVDPSEVKIDEVIVVNPGEKIPLDGVVISGASTLDTKALTGESLPRDVGCGEEVIRRTRRASRRT